MRVFLDQGTPFRAAALLRQNGWEALHAREIDLSRASDPSILDAAAAKNWIVITLDTDFHQLLAVSGATKPSVVRIRIEGLSFEPFVALILRELPFRAEVLKAGCVMSITSRGARLRRLPLPPVSKE